VLDVHIVHVADGDSFTAVISKRIVKCRLFGIDAPELKQPHGQQARQHFAKLVLGKTLQGTIRTIDCYGRTVVDLWSFSTQRLGILLLRTGMAWHTPRWSPDRYAFKAAQEWAMAGRIGLWANPNPVPPWTWRRAQGSQYTRMMAKRRLRIRHP
jgi:endonuclease YncB( thermonuclease family)